jgi:tRNA pseudouridine38-40 synthase
LKLEYDGTPFVGWQFQVTGPSVQSVLEAAVAKLEGAHVPITAAGRTDSGVHASAQVVHLDLTRQIEGPRLVAAINHHLKPHPVAVVQAATVAEDFNARFSAIGRAYCYRILNRPARPALLAGRVWHVPSALDVAAMHKGAQFLIGRHDFTSFRAGACQANSPLRTLARLDVQRDGDIVEIIAEARSFLHHQVRNMVGSLKLVGEGRWPAGVGGAGSGCGGTNRAAAGAVPDRRRLPDGPVR